MKLVVECEKEQVMLEVWEEMLHASHRWTMGFTNPSAPVQTARGYNEQVAPFTRITANRPTHLIIGEEVFLQDVVSHIFLSTPLTHVKAGNRTYGLPYIYGM